ncbi:hypothetical protein ACFWM3_17930 [Gottfriedia sp. NPDC058432]|uniref:hypothetical protein n=1 Tax=Gottfriedia sp. NPDC058432 TaxID=3346497 RepID=UPI0036699A3F
MYLKFQKINPTKNQQLYISNRNCNFYETYFGDSDFKDLTKLLKKDVKKVIYQYDSDILESYKALFFEEGISYNFFNSRNKKEFIIFSNIKEEQIELILESYFQVCSINGLGLLCLGDDIQIEFEKSSKLLYLEKIFGESWFPKCTLGKKSACLYLQFDAGSLVLVEETDHYMTKIGEYWVIK